MANLNDNRSMARCNKNLNEAFSVAPPWPRQYDASMKCKFKSKFLALSAALACMPALANDFGAMVTDLRWRDQNVPEGQQCRRDGGQGASPRLVIGRLPEGTNRIVVEFSDRTDKQLNNGGQGRIGLKVSEGATGVIFPSIPGHTFELPSDRMYLIEAHRGDDEPGAYLPPCSGGMMHLYTVRVMAAREEGGQSTVLATEDLILGYY